MHAWRIVSQIHAADLTGVGGLKASGRWHHRGRPILYTSGTASLAVLETLVHVDPSTAPGNLALIEIEIPDDIAVETCDPFSLAPDWQVYPFPVQLQEYGSTWLAEDRSAVLIVPSAVLPIEQNYIINPVHPGTARIRIVRNLPFAFDPRLVEDHTGT